MTNDSSLKFGVENANVPSYAIPRMVKNEWNAKQVLLNVVSKFWENKKANFRVSPNAFLQISEAEELFLILSLMNYYW